MPTGIEVIEREDSVDGNDTVSVGDDRRRDSCDSWLDNLSLGDQRNSSTWLVSNGDGLEAAVDLIDDNEWALGEAAWGVLLVALGLSACLLRARSLAVWGWN